MPPPNRQPDLPLRPPADPAADVVRWLFPAYILLILVGFFALRADGVMPPGNPLNHDRAVFQAVNAATLTGFQYSIHPSAYFLPGKVVLFLLTVAGTLFALIVGGLAVKRILRLPWSDWRILWAALICQAVAILIGLMFNTCPGGAGASMFDSVFQAAAAFANSGLYISPAGPPLPSDATTHTLLLPMSILGGLGLTVLIELFDSIIHQRPLSRHAKVVLGTTAGVYLVGFAVSLLFQALSPDVVREKSVWSATTAPVPTWRTVLLNASFAPLNARTLGLPIAPIHRDLAPMAFLTVLLMFVGASPGGTGGGLKTTTLHALFCAPRRAFANLPAGRPFAFAAVWLGLYLLTLCLIHPLLMRFAPQLGGDQSLFLTVSALSNVGLAPDRVTLTGIPLYLLSAAMFAGRIIPLLILWWMADSTRDAEDVAIG